MAHELKTKKSKKEKKQKKVRKPKKKKVKRFKNVTNITEQSISKRAKEKQAVPLMDTQYPQEVPYRQQVLFGTGSFNQMGDRFDNTIAQNERIRVLEQDVADAKERLLHQPLQPTEMNPPLGEPINIPSLRKQPKQQQKKKFSRRLHGGKVVRNAETNLSQAVSRPAPEPSLIEVLIGGGASSLSPSPPTLTEVLEGGGASSLHTPSPPTIRYRKDGITPIRPYNRKKPPAPALKSVLEDLNKTEFGF